MCNSKVLEKAFTYTQPPKGEVVFSFNKNPDYYREYWQCQECGHFVAGYDLDLSTFYDTDYVEATYKDLKGIHNNFKRIISLDPSKSDNAGRAVRIHEFAKSYFKDLANRTLLDVGSGLGVFPYVMKQLGWDCTALDPDGKAIEHLEKYIEIKARKVDFSTVSSLGEFDVITFNKVLEHVVDPIGMLKKSSQFLKPDGFVYVELPDAEAAASEGKTREEFFIEHLHVFSLSSIKILAEKGGFTVIAMERLQEPSTKYTLRSFLASNGGKL